MGLDDKGQPKGFAFVEFEQEVGCLFSSCHIFPLTM